jgi:hypothetical protein
MRASHRLLLAAAVIGLLFLAACGSGGPRPIKCKAAADCFAADSSKDSKTWNAACTDRKCVFTPKPDVCGNGKWEPDSDKDCASCAKDCKGKVPGAPKFEYTCVGAACVEGVSVNASKTNPSSVELTMGGSKVRLDTQYPDPLNIKQQAFDLAFTLRTLGVDVSDFRITRLEMTAQTPQKQSLTVGEQSLSLPLPVQTAKGEARLALDFPASGMEGQLTGPALSIDFAYRLKGVPKTGSVKTNYKTPINWLAPRTDYPCPGCPEKPGYSGDCLPGTAICVYAAQAGACGNNICEAGEDRCTCAGDCGKCEGAAGSYLDLACGVGGQCEALLRPGITVQPQNILDVRDAGKFTLQNKYLYNNPLDVVNGRLGVEMTLTAQDDDVAAVTITAIRLLDGSNEVVSVAPKRRLDLNKLARFDVAIPAQPQPEQVRSLTLSVSYEFDKSGEKVPGTFTKPLTKVTLLTPGPLVRS